MNIMCKDTLATRSSMKGLILFHIETNHRPGNLHQFNRSFLRNLARHSRQSNVDTNSFQSNDNSSASHHIRHSVLTENLA